MTTRKIVEIAHTLSALLIGVPSMFILDENVIVPIIWLILSFVGLILYTKDDTPTKFVLWSLSFILWGINLVLSL